MNKKSRSRLDRISKIAKIGFLNTALLKGRRKLLGMTLAEAAKLAGMKSGVQWHNYESGRNKDLLVSTLMKMAAAIQIDPAELLRKR